MISPKSKNVSQNMVDPNAKSNYRRSIFKNFLKKDSSLNISTSSSNISSISPVSSKSKNISGNSSSGNRSKSNSLRRNGSTKSGKSTGDTTYIDQDDLSIYNSDDDENTEMSEVPDGEFNSSETSSNYSNLQRTGSMTFIDKNATSLDEKSSELIDAKLFELLKSSAEENVDYTTAWEDFKHESLMVPKYMKPNKRNKNAPEIFKRLFLAQQLNDESDSDSNSMSETNSSEGIDSKSETLSNPIVNSKISKEIFVMQFSGDGKYLAVAGRDSVIKVWKVISSPLGRMEYNNYEAHSKSNSSPKHSEDEIYKYGPVFHQKPVRVFKGHTNSVLTIDWSKNNFLISGSMDKTVKLWHIDKPNTLATFQHEDFVTTVKFHPSDDRFFLSGSLDNQARIWSILERSVAYGRHLGDEMLITASNFTPDGAYCLFGGFNGTMAVLETKGLHILNRFDIKQKTLVPLNNTNGNKVTNIKIFKSNEDNPNHDFKQWTYLITTNDSKIRLINVKDKRLVTRFKGATNTGSIEASTTDDYRYVLSGSEDHWVYVWENNNNRINSNLKSAVKDIINDGAHHISELPKKHKKYYKFLTKNKLFNKINRELLHNEEVDLISNENSSHTSFHAHHSNVNAAIFAPNSTKKLLELSDDLIFDLIKRARICGNFKSSDNTQLPDEESFENGNEGFIIVTTDDYGLIRVFRHDPAYDIRKRIIDIYKKAKEKDKDLSLPCDVKGILNKKLPCPPTSAQKSKLQYKSRLGADSPTFSTASVPTVTTKSSTSGGFPEILKIPSTQSVPNTKFNSSPLANRQQLKSISKGLLSSNDASLSIHTEVPLSSEGSSFAKLINSDGIPAISSSGAITPEHELPQPFPTIEIKDGKPKRPAFVSTLPNQDLKLSKVTSPLSATHSHEDSLKDLKFKRVNK